MMSHPIDRKALEEAINQARAGNDAEFATLYKYYYPQVCKHLIRMVGSYEDGHNLCQDSFLKAWRAIRGKAESQFRGNTEPEFRSWLYRIATNTANDYLRVPRPEDRLNGSREHPTGLGSVEDKDFINRALAE